MTRKNMSPTNHELQLANDFVQYTGCNIFLTGKAGTGKTTFLHNRHMSTISSADSGSAKKKDGLYKALICW
jgi:ABC-type lipoprotein export system ATPase subunit